MSPRQSGTGQSDPGWDYTNSWDHGHEIGSLWKTPTVMKEVCSYMENISRLDCK